jgi:hypothetical protein
MKTDTKFKNAAEAQDADALLRQAIAAGLDISRALTIFAEGRSAEEKRYLDVARKRFSAEGHLKSESCRKFEDNAAVGPIDDDGAYVMCWQWVDARCASIPTRLENALRAPFEAVVVTLPDQDVDATYTKEQVVFHERALLAVEKGCTLPGSTWLIRSQTGDVRHFEITFAHFKALVFHENIQSYKGKLNESDDDELYLEFLRPAEGIA